MIHREDRESVAVLRMEHGKANAVDLELFEALGRELDEVEAGGQRAVVLTGSGGIFSAGVDLYRVLDGGAEYLAAFLPELANGVDRLYRFPLPVVAAVNGHALAGGCVLACACDRRIMAEGKGKIGVTELSVGVPFPGIALEVFRQLLPAPKATELILSGRMLGPEEAAAIHLVDELSPAEELMDRALAAAEAMARIPAASFALTKKQLRLASLARIETLESLDDEIMEEWSKPEMLQRIAHFLEQTVGRKKGE